MNPKNDGSPRPPDWLRPRGVAAGTWEYVNERTIASRYDAFVADTPLCELDQRLLAEHLGPFTAQRKQTVLDLGCGMGRHAIPLTELGCDVVAIDLSRDMLAELVAKCRSRAIEVVVPLHANLVELDGLRDEIADHAICLFSTLGMIQGRANRRQFLRHVNRPLRPGGTFVVHVHRRWAALRERGGLRSLAHSWWQSIGRGESEFGDTVYGYRGLSKMFMHRFSERELRADLTQTGWRIENVQRIGLTGEQTVDRSWDASGFFVTAVRA
ncbi:MAG: methyltransferase domain-containing protein [Planctomycetota bacterium]